MLWQSYAIRIRTLLWFGHGCSGQRMLLEQERNYGLGMGALAVLRNSNTNVIMVWAWMLWSTYALGTRRELWFWHGCSGQRMLLEHERNHALSMDALAVLRNSNTNFIMVWAWMLWSAHALGTGTELWFWHGCSGQRILLEHEGNYGFGMDTLAVLYAIRTRTLLWLGHGCFGAPLENLERATAAAAYATTVLLGYDSVN